MRRNKKLLLSCFALSCALLLACFSFFPMVTVHGESKCYDAPYVTPENAMAPSASGYKSVSAMQEEYAAAGITQDLFTKVESYQLISSLTSHTQFGNNKWGSCASVAAVIIFRYYQQKYYLSMYPKSSAEFNAKYPIPDDATDSKGHNLAYVNTADETVYEKMHKYFFYKQAQNSAWDFGVINGATTYMEQQTCFKDALGFTIVRTTETNTSYYNRVKNNINQGKPTYAVISFYGSDIDSPVFNSGTHAIVIYGYYTTGSESYYLFHMGWDSQYGHLGIVNSKYVTQGTKYCGWGSYNASGMHSHNYGYEQYDENQHYKVCSNCIYYDVAPHHYNSMVGRFYVCSDCGQKSLTGIVTNGALGQVA